MVFVFSSKKEINIEKTTKQTWLPLPGGHRNLLKMTEKM
jgi:hypothetical protein